MAFGLQRWIARCAATMFAGAAITSVPAGQESAAEAVGTTSRSVRVLCLGDSMTAGDESNPSSFRSYRGRLLALLAAGGHRVDFVGTIRDVPAIGGDPDHDGYGGAYIGPGGSANNLADRLDRILSAVDPDIIILAFGWNSAYHEPSVAGARYTGFVERLAARRPRTDLIVATLSPQRGQTEAQSVAAIAGYASINRAARSLALASATDRIHLADFAAAGFQSADYHDVIHWSQQGADRAARVLYRALVDGPLRP